MKLIGGVIIGIGILLMLLWCLVPVYWVVRTSLMLPRAVWAVPPEWLPSFPTLFNYLRVLGFHTVNPQGETLLPSRFSPVLLNGLANSIVVASFVAIFTILLATPMSYAFSRYSFPHKNKILFTLLLTRAIPPVTMAVPYYHLYYQWGILGTRFGLAAVYLAMTVPIMVWVLMGLFSALPTDIESAGRLDGLGRFEIFRRIFLPLAKPSITIVAILAFLMAWNEYSLALILTTGTPAMTLPIALRSVFGEITLQSAALTMSIMAPLLMAFGLQNMLSPAGPCYAIHGFVELE